LAVIRTTQVLTSQAVTPAKGMEVYDHGDLEAEFLQLLGVGVSALGMQPLLGRVAFAAADGLPAWAALPQGATPKTGGKLVYGQTYPNWAVGNSDNGKHPYFWIDLLTRSIWNSLAWVDHDYNVQGELAESWSPVDDTLKVWDFKLREGVQFHNGKEMTSEDVVASINGHVAQKATSLFTKWLDKVEPQGKYGVRFTLKSPYAEWLFALAEYRIVIVPAAAAETIFRTASAPVRSSWWKWTTVAASRPSAMKITG
jgi:peptide/nickel transport system substrate-binding protein